MVCADLMAWAWSADVSNFTSCGTFSSFCVAGRLLDGHEPLLRVGRVDGVPLPPAA